MSHPYRDFIHRVEKPARYLGGEHNSIRKGRASVDVTMALAFPDLYDIGMSHLGTKILYSVLNGDPRIAAERAFAPWPDLERELRARGLPLVSLESARPLRDFDVVGFSLQYELTYTNVLLMLDLGGIPLRSADRGEGHPLVIAGGPSATHAEPMSPFLDAVLVGDGEERTPELLHAWAAARREGLPRARALRRLARLEGVYVPALHETAADPATGLLHVSRPIGAEAPARVRRALVADINRFPFPDDSPEPVAEAIFDRMAIEIARGCTEGCRFCQAGMITRPVRERDPRAVVDSVLGAVRKGGYDEVSLTALSTADVSCIAPLVEKVSGELAARKVSLSISSLRAYGLPAEVLDDLSQVRAAGLTFAPEAGTQRMRDVISKNITDEDMITTAHRVFSRGFEKPKLYFMIGLPTETDEDVAGIIVTARRLRDVGLKYLPRGRVDVTVSVSTHVPKPHTPFQWCAMDTLEEIDRKQGILRDLAREARLTLRLHDPRGSYLEGVLGRGDRRLAAVIEHAYGKGCRFDGWDEHLRFDTWREAFDAVGIDPRAYLATLPVGARLPWDHIDVGLEEGFLLKEYRKALAGKLSPPCGKPVHAKVHHTNLEDARADARRLVCYECGVACDLGHMREERHQFLQVLDASRRREPAPDIAPRADKEPGRRRPEPRARFRQAPGIRYRLAYSKLGRAAFMGHLDLVRTVPRILRRAGLELHYSEGFHPHPVISFGPALGLGIPSLAEYADATVQDDLAPAELLRRLAGFAPEGMRFTGVRRLGEGEPGLSKVLSLGDYLAAVPDGVAADLDLDLAGRAARVQRKGVVKEVPLAEVVVRLEPVAASRVPGELELPAAGRFLFLRLRLAGGLKPAEVLATLAGRDVEPGGIARTGLWSADLEDPLGGAAAELQERPGRALPLRPAASA